MKPTADRGQILTGSEAVEHMTESWRDIGMGMVDVEVIGPWLVVRRAGGDYTTFLSLADDTAVTILSDSATTRHIPEDERPAGEVSDSRVEMLERAFGADSAGMYPQPDEGVFVIAFREGDTHRYLRVGLTEDVVEITADD